MSNRAYAVWGCLMILLGSLNVFFAVVNMDWFSLIQFPIGVWLIFWGVGDIEKSRPTKAGSNRTS